MTSSGEISGGLQQCKCSDAVESGEGGATSTATVRTELLKQDQQHAAKLQNNDNYITMNDNIILIRVEYNIILEY